ncbi:MAG: type II toxin-antitoxin system VapC family toxin, partial [Desulfuromonadales bacterium]
MTWRQIPDGARVALDTVVLVYFLERHPEYYPSIRDLFRRIEENHLDAVMSSLALTELLVPAYRQNQPNAADRLVSVLQGFPHLK